MAEAEALSEEVGEEAVRVMDEGIPIGEVPTQAIPTAEATDVVAEGILKETAEAAPNGPASLVNEEALRAAIADKPNVTLGQLEDTRWFNLDKMDGPLDADVMIEVVGDALGRSGALEKLGLATPETFDMVLKGAKEELAGMVGTGVDAFTKRVAAVSAVAQDQAKFLVSGKMALQTIGREIGPLADRLSRMYALGKVDPELEDKLLSLMTSHANLQGHLKSVQTAAARATSAGRITTHDGLDAAALTSLDRVNAAGGSEALKKAVEKLRLAGTPAQQAAVIRAMQRGGRLHMGIRVANEVFINSILSGIPTHVANITSNTISTAVLPIERMMGAALTGSKKELRAGLAQYSSLSSAVFDGIRMAGRVLRTENPILDQAVKIETQLEGAKAISRSNFGVTSELGGGVIDFLGHVIRLPGRALMAEDEFFKQITFRSRLKGNLIATAAELPVSELNKLGYKTAGEFVEGEMHKAVLGIQAVEDAWDKYVTLGKVQNTPEAKATFIRNNSGIANEGSVYAQDALRTARDATFTSPPRWGYL